LGATVPFLERKLYFVCYQRLIPVVSETTAAVMPAMCYHRRAGARYEALQTAHMASAVLASLRPEGGDGRALFRRSVVSGWIRCNVLEFKGQYIKQARVIGTSLLPGPNLVKLRAW
jgi:hypothetical protein